MRLKLRKSRGVSPNREMIPFARSAISLVHALLPRTYFEIVVGSFHGPSSSRVESLLLDLSFTDQPVCELLGIS